MRRQLEAAGLDFHALAEIVTIGSRASIKSAQRNSYKNGFRDGLDPAVEDEDDDSAAHPTWHAMAIKCSSHAKKMKLRERQFIEQMVRWTAKGREPSAKQARWLDFLYEKFNREK